MNHDLIKQLSIKTESRIVLLVIDGLGGLPDPATGLTELETARTPNLDRLAEEGTLGLTLPIDYGITPGSGPAHLSLFGYDPIGTQVGRGILDILGVGFDLQRGDVAARINFCTVDSGGLVTDRRAGRIPDEEGRRLCEHLNANIKLDGVESFVVHTKEYRGGIILRGEGLEGAIADTDPQVTGKETLPAKAKEPGSQHTAELFNDLIAQAKQLLAGEQKANMILVRGVDAYHPLVQMQELYKLDPVCVAAYPMYRGLAKLVGMKLVDIPSTATIEEEFDALEAVWHDHDFFFVHIKKTDSAGEDGDFDKKVHVIEELDEQIPRLFALVPDCIIVSGDHSTPARMKSHSWHPLPTMLWSGVCRRDRQKHYGETACSAGGMGHFAAMELMALAMANSGKLLKFGA